MRTVYPFRPLFMSASTFLRKGSSRRKAATKIRIRINKTDPPIQRNDLLVARFLKRKSKFLRTETRSEVVGDFTNELFSTPIDRMVFLYVVRVFEFLTLLGKSRARRTLYSISYDSLWATFSSLNKHRDLTDCVSEKHRQDVICIFVLGTLPLHKRRAARLASLLLVGGRLILYSVRIVPST